MRIRLVALVAVAVLAACLEPAAASAFGLRPGAEGFSVAATNADSTPTTQAGAHPDSFSVNLALNGEAGDLRSARMQLPPGFLINPTTVSECSASAFHTPRSSPKEASSSGESCPNSTQLGVLTVSLGGTVRHYGLFNLVPAFGTAAAIGASPSGIPLVFESHLREGDSGLDLDLASVPAGIGLESIGLTIWGTPWRASHDAERGNCLNEQTGGSWGGCLVFEAAPAPESQQKSFLTLPTTPCGQPLSYPLTLTSWQGAEAGAQATTPALAACNKPLSIVKVQLMSAAAAARTGLAVTVDVNSGGGITNPGGIARPALKTAHLTLPAGLTINPSLGAGLGVCSAADFARETATSEPGSGCPNPSKIGSVVLEGELGLPEPMSGSIYLATPHDNPFGSLFAVYMRARDARRGLIVKSQGVLEPSPTTGALVATFEQLPRLLYTHFALTLREGQRSVLVSPPLCGAYPATLSTASWAEPEAFTSEASTFSIVAGEGGGPCPAGGAPPFHPALLSGSINPQAAAYTPFYLRLTRTDGEQEFTSYSATLPPGLLADIGGVATCSDSAIDAARQSSGTAQQQNPSCPAAALIGHTIAGYGVGGTLAYAPGNLYLGGPYHGAPLSIVAIDSALVGPFDLGTVVVRQAVRIDPTSVQVSLDPTGSDPIPHILDGIPLHLRDIRVYVDRSHFTVNPTSCDPAQVSSTVGGSGTDPLGPGDDTTATTSQRYQLLGCSALAFRPKLALRLGAARHGAFPNLRATYTVPAGAANLRSVAVRLPPSLFLEQGHIRGVCTRAQFAAQACPASSIYGHASALTPLLEAPLEGPVYLRSSSGSVPDLVTSLHGRGIEIDVAARIDQSRGGVRATFEGLPDGPVSSFTMSLDGGRRGLLVNSEPACPKPHKALARFIGQNNATWVAHPPITARCRKIKKTKKKTPAKSHRP